MRAAREVALSCAVLQQLRTRVFGRGFNAASLPRVPGEREYVQKNAGGRKPPGRNARRRT
jgi:hypothetical protein